MNKIEVDYTMYLKETCEKLQKPGALLASLDTHGRPNAMTIGWGTIGVVWGKPTFAVLVRPSRYTHECIEATGDFTVNVPTHDMTKIVAVCGTQSGREHDKFAEQGLTAVDGLHVKSPIIGECPVSYECKVVARKDLSAAGLEAWIERDYYPKGDLHRVYYGEIQVGGADDDAAAKLHD